MAIVHRADLRPSKVELLAAWLPQQPWCDSTGDVDRVAAFRFDDPAGEVGIESYVMRRGTAVFHVPMTYRGAPLEGATLIGELEHSVLGHRWVYDGPSDPVYVDVIRRAIVDAARDVDMVLDDGTPVPRLEWWATAVGSGAEPALLARSLRIARRLPADPPTGAPTLSASWSGQGSPSAVAWLSDQEEA